MTDEQLLDLLEDVVCEESLGLEHSNNDPSPDTYSCSCCGAYSNEDDLFGQGTGFGGIVHDEDCVLDRLVSGVNRRLNDDHDAPSEEELIELLQEAVSEDVIDLEPHAHPNGADSMHCRGCSGWTEVKGHAWNGFLGEVRHDDDCKLMLLVEAVSERNSDDS